MNEVATQRKSPIVNFKHNLSRLVDANELTLPSNVSTDAFKNAAIVAVQDNPSILQCSDESLFKSIRRLAAAGLVPDGREAALVPFKGKCTAIPMVFGLIKMARRSGDVRDIRAHTIHEHDEFEYIVGDEERLTHKPVLFGDKGEPLAYYAIAILKDGTKVRTFMDRDEVDKIRRGAASQGGSANPKGIWQDHYEQMAHKTVIRRLVKRLDLSAEDMRHITMDDDNTASVKDITPPSQEPSLAQRITQPEEPPETVEGEIMDDSPHWTEEIDTSECTPLDDGFDEGVKAFKDGTPREDCPTTAIAMAWLHGWDEAQKVSESA